MLRRRRPGPRGSGLPPQCSAPAGRIGGPGLLGCTPGSPRRRHILAPARGLRGRLSGAPEAAGGRGALLPSWSSAAERPRSRRRRLLPTRSPGSPAPARPSFPSPPGRPCPWRALAARLHPGPVRPAGQPFLARPAESQRWPHPPRPPGSWLAPGAPPPSPPHFSDAHFTDGN